MMIIDNDAQQKSIRKKSTLIQLNKMMLNSITQIQSVL